MIGKVLIIEDDQGLLETLILMLEQAEFEVQGTTNPTAAWDLLFRFNPEVVVTDVNMKPLDGFQLLGMIRQHPDIAHLPVIIMTVESARHRRRTGMQLGADDYLDKPFGRGELVAAINAQLAKRRAVTGAIDRNVADLRKNITMALPHELNTPLAVVLGLAEVIADDDKLPEATRHMADGIRKAGQRLHQLTNNFLYYSECEQLAANRAAVAEMRRMLTPNTRHAIETPARLLAQQVGRPADLALELAGELGAAIGEIHLVRILKELLGNAFKYSAPGTPVIVRSTGDAERFQLTITDHGRGFPAAATREIGAFRQFGRQEHEQQGAGLGLAICLRLVQIHAGSLSFESKPGEGATAKLVLPRAPRSP